MQQVQPPRTDLYGLLNLAPDATNEQIQKAYKSLSRTFHPDRLSYQSDLQAAQETFVEIKNAHEILCDPVRRFAYDQHGWKGVDLLSRLSKIPKHYAENYQQFHLSSLIGLEDELRQLLEQYHDHKNVECILQAKFILQGAMEEYKEVEEHIQEQQQRSPVQFEGTLEYPCAYEYDTNLLEMESAYLNCMVRHTTKITTNTTPTPQQQQQQGNGKSQSGSKTTTATATPKRQVITTAMGTTMELEHNGKADISSLMEFSYKPNTQSQVALVVNTPLTHRLQESLLLLNHKVSISTTHEFTNGTAMILGVRGGTRSWRGWAYSLVTQRILNSPGTSSLPNANATESDNEAKQKTKIHASWALGLRAVDGKVAYCLTTLKTIPPVSTSVKRQQQKQQEQQRLQRKHKHDDDDQQQHQQQFKGIKPWLLSMVPCWWSIPILKLKLGVPQMMCNISSNFEYFGYEWLSLYASMAWNSSAIVPKAKILLSCSTLLSSTTIKTGFRHDDLLGWIWLWEWDEDDWSFSIPIAISSFSASSSLDDLFHETIFWSIILSTLGVVSGIVKDLYGFRDGSSSISNQTRKNKENLSPEDDEDEDDFFDTNATSRTTTSSSMKHRDKSVDSFNGNYTFFTEQLPQLMLPIAQKKRKLEEDKNGLVILFARRTHHWTAAAPSPRHQPEQNQIQQQQPTDYYDRGEKQLNNENEVDLTCQLQFWVVDGKLSLPLSNDAASMSWVGLQQQQSSEEGKEEKQQEGKEVGRWWPQNLKNWYSLLSVRDSSGTKKASTDSNKSHRCSTRIRYTYQGNVYEVTISDTEKMLVLPHPKAQCLGKAGVVS